MPSVFKPFVWAFSQGAGISKGRALLTPPLKQLETVETCSPAENFSRRRSALATATETSGSAARRLRAAAFFEDMPIPGAASTRDARAGVSAGTFVRRCGFLLSRKTGEEHFLLFSLRVKTRTTAALFVAFARLLLSNACSLANAYILINKATHA